MKTFIFLLLFIFTSNLIGQVGIGTNSPNAASALDINSTTKGFLPPRMTISDRNAIVTPIAGLIIWCSNCGPTGQLQLYNGTNWTGLVSGVPADIIVGDNYGGGKIAYILQSSDPGYVAGETHGLIAAPNDNSTGADWGCSGVGITGADGFVIGTGNQNTIDIVTGCVTAGIAAKICSDLVLDGFSDWYLPSRDELGKLYQNRIAIGGFTTNLYWTSTESAGPLTAWQCDFSSGVFTTSLKTTFDYVRAIRAF